MNEFDNVPNQHQTSLQALDIIHQLVGEVTGTRADHEKRTQLIKFLKYRLEKLHTLEQPSE